MRLVQHGQHERRHAVLSRGRNGRLKQCVRHAYNIRNDRAGDATPLSRNHGSVQAC